MTISDTPGEGLDPCPFCGNRNVAQGASREYISVWCDCGARGPEVPFPVNRLTEAQSSFLCWMRDNGGIMDDPHTTRIARPLCDLGLTEFNHFERMWHITEAARRALSAKPGEPQT